MKIKSSLLLVIASTLLVAGCSPSDNEDRLINKDVYSLMQGGSVEVIGTVDLFFKANDTVPYISLKDGANYIDIVRNAKLGKASPIKVDIKDDVITYTNNLNATCTINSKNQTITYSDFDSFNFINSSVDETLSLYTPTVGVISRTSTKYTKKNDYSIDLKNYSKIDIYKYSNNYYLPLTTYSDIFLSATEGFSLVYNNSDVFLLSSSMDLSIPDSTGKYVLTNIGKKFYSGKKKKKVSQSFAEYYYQNVLLNFDYLYGIKSLKNYSSFDSYLSSKGFKEDMLSGDVHKMDNAFVYALTTLKDGHTSLSETSPFYGFDEATIDSSKMDSDHTKWLNDGKKLKVQRTESNAKLGFDVDINNGIAYIAFNSFTAVNEGQLKQTVWTKEQILNNNATLFATSYKQITSEQYKDVVKYVVVDLATNDGGSADGMIYAIGTLIGGYKTNILGAHTGSLNQSTFKVDINLDGKIDENDKSLYELGYKIAFVNSKYSYSCGNAMPIMVKENKSDVIMMGETTGGGTCVVRTAYSALGSQYSISGLQMIAQEKDGKIINVEDGIKADIALTENEMLDRTIVANKLLSFSK